MEWYDTKIQDSPIHDKSDFKLYTLRDLERYHQFDPDDPNEPFVQGIDLDTTDEEDSPDIKIVKTSADQRVQHIRVRGSPDKALRLIAERDKRGIQ
jgi:hypothetical protein